MAVNASNDVLIGYSRFSAFQYASGNYSFRFATDPLNTLRADTVLKAGEGTYLNTGNSKLNRWGDYSSTVVDPVDDTTLWTIQEYAASDNRWGTWWGRVEPDLSALRIALARPADGITYPSNPTVTLTATRLDTNVTFTLVEFYADDSKIGQATAEPFTTTWVNATDGPHALVAIATDSLGGLAMSSVVTIFVGDRGSPVGTWEAKISGPAKGNAVVIFGDDFSISGYGMTLGTFGLFTISGAWSFNTRQQIAGSYIEWLDGSDIFSGSFVGKAAGGRKVSVQVTSESVPKALRLKGKPLATVPDLRGNWLATVKAAGALTMETYELTPSATLTNVLDLTGQTSSGTLTGAVLVNSRGQLNVSTEGAAERSLAGKAKAATSLSLKGQDEAGQRVTVKATR